MTYYVLGQNRLETSARITMDSLPEDWYSSKGPISISLYDPKKVGDMEHEFGSNSYGDIIDGSCSIYSDRLCEALKAFGIDANYKPVHLFETNGEVPVKGYNMVLGVPDAGRKCFISATNELENFTLDASKVTGLSLFDLHGSYCGLRVIDQKLKDYLETIELQNVSIVATPDYGRDLVMLHMYG